MKFFKTADARPLRRGLLDAELVLEQHVVVRRQPDACTHDVDKAVTLHTSTHTSTDSRLSRVIGSAGRGLARARWQLQTVGTAGLTGGDFTHALTEQKKTAGRRVDRGRLQGGAVLGNSVCVAMLAWLPAGLCVCVCARACACMAAGRGWDLSEERIDDGRARRHKRCLDEE